MEVLWPVDDLLVRVSWVFRAEGSVTDEYTSDERIVMVKYHSPNETFEEDGAERPPVALFAITLEKEDFWCDLYPVEWGGANEACSTHIVWRADG